MTESTTPGAASQSADGTAVGSWVLDPAGSTAEFGVRHFWGAITVRGTLGPMAGEAAVSPDGTVTGQITFDTSSLDTGHKQRDKHLRSADFFHADEHPEAVLTVTSGRPAGPDGLACQGTLDVAGQKPRHLHRAHPGGDRAGRRPHRRASGRPGGVRHDLEPAAHGLDDGTGLRPGAIHPRLSRPGRSRAGTRCLLMASSPIGA